jgi:ABC-type proline/glycine betaine transport system ATPase subunit
LVTPHFHRRDQQQRREHRQQNVIRNKSEQMTADKGANELLRKRRMATVFVTHDLAEASNLCDRCAILDAGTILQDEPVPTLLRCPRTPRVAEIVGIENVTQQGL